MARKGDQPLRHRGDARRPDGAGEPEARVRVVAQLQVLAEQEYALVAEQVRGLPPPARAGLLIEACRVLDHTHIVQLLANRPDDELSVHDFDIMVRGWNLLAAELFKGWGDIDGVPLKASTPPFQAMLASWLHACGRSAVFSWAAEMARYGMVDAVVDGQVMVLALSDRAAADHFHDQLDHARLVAHNVALFDDYRPFESPDDASPLRAAMAELAFPWPTSQGLMVGYSNLPEIDEHFLRVTYRRAVQWRDDAGVHPDAVLPGCSGRILAQVVHALMSLHLKHIMFVSEAKQRDAKINAHMSFTVWRPRQELLAGLVSLTGAPEPEVSAALDLITVDAGDRAYFATERAPGLPLVIKISEQFVLLPISGVFRNPFNLIRMLRTSTSTALQNALRIHREAWMADDLYALFDGPRFQCVAGQTELSRNKQHVTDIDAAIFDNATGDLVLFQLKWQDFSTSAVKSQRSRAENYTSKVSSWVTKVTLWTDQFGVAALCSALRVKLPSGASPRCIRFVAIGRSNARFRSYGYDLGPAALSLPWAQFTRLRHEIGSGQDFFALLEQRLIEEGETAIARTPLPYVLERDGWTVKFADLWSSFDDEDEAGGAFAEGGSGFHKVIEVEEGLS